MTMRWKMDKTNEDAVGAYDATNKTKDFVGETLRGRINIPYDLQDFNKYLRNFPD